MKENYLIYTPDYFPVIGGAEIFISEYVNFLKDNVKNITIITRRPTKASMILNNIKLQPIHTIENNIEIYRAPYLEIKYLRVFTSIFMTYIFLLTVLVKRKYNYIHFIGFYPSALIWKISKNFYRNAKIIYTEQGMLVDVIRNGINIYDASPSFLRKIINQFFSDCEKIICVSDGIKNKLNYINSSLKVQVIPNGTYIQDFVFRLDKDYRIITTSRLVQKNNLKSLINAMPLVIKKFKGNGKIFLDIVGDGEERNSIQKLIEINNLNDNVIIHGTLNKKSVQQMYQNSNLFCRLSISEGFGISFIEALSWGLPIIGSEIIGAMAYYSNDYGLIVKNINDLDEISEAILFFLNDKNQLEKSSILAYEAAKKYDWNLINKLNYDYIFLN